jgi:hypothetical protein
MARRRRNPVECFYRLSARDRALISAYITGKLWDGEDPFEFVIGNDGLLELVPEPEDNVDLEQCADHWGREIRLIHLLLASEEPKDFAQLARAYRNARAWCFFWARRGHGMADAFREILNETEPYRREVGEKIMAFHERQERRNAQQN